MIFGPIKIRPQGSGRGYLLEISVLIAPWEQTKIYFTGK
jgi:hypothetical protein